MAERTTTIDVLLDQFASTFKEWHYFVGGAAIGFILGVYLALRLSFRYD